MGRRGRKTSDMIRIAQQRIDSLFLYAIQCSRDGDMQLSDRYVRLAFRICTRYNLRIPEEYKPLYCRKCFAFIGISSRSRQRLQKKKVVTTCLECGNIRRSGYQQKPMKLNGGILIE